MIRSPEFLILDEPTVGVDPVSRRELWSIVNRLVRKESMSVLLSTTYLDEAEKCDAVVMLQDGKVLDFGEPRTLSSRQTGKTYLISAPGMKKRRLRKKISKAKGVLDAVISGDFVRIVMEEFSEPRPSLFGLDSENVEVAKVEPRFEDEYITILKQNMEKKIEAAENVLEPQQPKNSADSDEKVIEVNHVKRKFGDFFAVKDVTFDVKRGEVFGLLGANGAGKTTTFRMICGLLPASEGFLKVAGRDLRSAAAAARARIGYMSQKFSLYGQLSVLENLDFFSGAYNLTGKRKRRRIGWAMDQFHLREMAGSTSGELPLGFKQRLALACSLMHEPEILFLDEPTSGVDPMARREFWNHINELAENGVTIMVTTHFMEEAEYCDRLALMTSGEILALGTPSEVKDKARGKSRTKIDSMEEAFIALIEAQPETEDAKQT
jgi:ABC-2 type transport system ATP-binding protein